GKPQFNSDKGAMMSKETPLVSYKQLNAALSKPESVAKTNAEAVATDPTQAAAAVVSMNHALALLEEASLDRDDKVMVSVDHRVASLLQTYMAEEAKKAGKIEPIGPDAYGKDRYEAKFDDKDY